MFVVDSIVYQGYQIPPYYDSLISKLIIFGNDRENCLSRSQRALDEFIIEPIDTSIELHKKLLRNKDIINGAYSIKWLEEIFLPKTELKLMDKISKLVIEGYYNGIFPMSNSRIDNSFFLLIRKNEL